ncbi:hypothetical protein CORC01_08317 [Colletotrichum orchidophilum]|uniref:Uncharacterized protein n=1 Tax=Colletotrichum orchidophilum TaxID=1209926 RepID=A0A1G4B4S1_9PEZI|nr:uncharacterized protein CORC01_08317 [Colletotrichum orchidophilum]OHE96394.1 hypothetical protein CORC01_08317 [Colletotrichum orchidophilum]
MGRDRGQFVSAVSRCSCSRSFVSLASASSHGRWIRTMAWRRKRAVGRRRGEKTKEEEGGGEEKRQTDALDGRGKGSGVE